MAWWKRGTDTDPTAVPARRASAEPAASSPESPEPPETPGFDLVRRGYDRDQVDARIAEVRRALAGGRFTVDTAQLRADGAANGLAIVRRGYDRTQVDTWFADAADRLDTR
ncbi:hypothetical protein GCM10023205_11220 [Yinghuangia aomiensis]|uniref:DivIVA domain-containing protein n=1 Tax=Yinghuangia aomiensis TaxID=676205 RepID=A0ABP9GT04_9ACTN